MDRMSRREAFSALAVAGGVLAAGRAAAAPPEKGAAARASVPVALAGTHQPLPLPFAPASLKGLSERLITSHHQNNYGGAVKNLNRVEEELAHTTTDTPPFVVAALRERELMFRNSKSLHEAYFANLGGDGRRSGAIEAALAQAYGTSARWEEDVRRTGAGFGGGSGWVVLSYELDTGALRTVGVGNHTQALASALPLLVMDMYEHSYQMDFGAAVPRYLEAFFANLKWDEVNRRFEAARRARLALGRGG
jgi:Fe-Mn family superoxide dismutase